MSSVTTLAFAYGGPIGAGRIRDRAEDFVVREVLGFEASGEGEHLLLIVRKRDANTKWVAKKIAERAGVRVREVGFAGLKDRHAITEQAFTVPSLKSTPESWVGFEGEGFRVLAAERQRRKLRRGAHRANDFEIVVRDFGVDSRTLDERLHRISKEGAPNYFGEQRFGANDRNLDVAQRWLCDGIAPRDRDERSFALSAARSSLFNAVVSRRIADGSWNRLLEGEVVNLDGTGSVFVSPTIDESLVERCDQLDVHPTGPLCGYGDSRVSGEAARIERSILEPWIAWQRGLEALRVEQQRRALRVAVRNLSWQYDNSTLALRFQLTSGAFATAVLREIVSYEASIVG